MSDGTTTLTSPTFTVTVVCPGSNVIGDLSHAPAITIDAPQAGASTIGGTATNIDTSKTRVVLWALTNQWYVQPLIATPFTGICSNGT